MILSLHQDLFLLSQTNAAMFPISIAPRFDWKIVAKFTLNHMDTKSIHITYNNTLIILETKFSATVEDLEGRFGQA